MIHKNVINKIGQIAVNLQRYFVLVFFYFFLFLREERLNNLGSIIFNILLILFPFFTLLPFFLSIFTKRLNYKKNYIILTFGVVITITIFEVFCVKTHYFNTIKNLLDQF